MTPTRVLVTGAGGFIGRHVVRDQVARGRLVRALDRNAEGMRSFSEVDSVEVLCGDIADEAIQRSVVEGVDVVVHLASAHLERGIPETIFLRVNVTAVESLLQRAEAAGVQRFVHVSSCGVHGSIGSHPGDENSPFRPEVAYERTKLAGEKRALEFGRSSRLSVVVLRPVWVYGPECGRTARLFRSIASRRFVMIGKGNTRRASVYISDFVQAVELGATRAGVANEVFIVSHDEPVTVQQIVEGISRSLGVAMPRLRLPVWSAWLLAAGVELSAKILHREPPISRRSLKFFTNDASFTCAKARKMLGFEPQVSLRDGLELTCRWWRLDGGGN